ncbi:DNA-binding response regulator [Actinomadura craniellae]|uniref:DNA-binding response regulator n=1 Tax=Actinomadura craniellae TaxID=2231787 RepID=A0A365H1Z1_9ACTN|nr:response regulator transcription factor [Actinomadura craniellae]RAY13058.1 DNA-binding response regulator [Actinomadura craniellae]
MSGTSCRCADGDPPPGAVLRVAVCGGPDVFTAGLAAVMAGTPGVRVVGRPGGDGLRRALRAEPPPAVVLLDLEELVPGLAELHEAAGHPAGIVAVRSAYDADTAVGVLRAGARGLLLKAAPVTQVVDAVRAVQAGGVFLAPPVARLLTERFLAQEAGPAVAEGPGLTARQREVLALVGEGLTNAEIAGRLGLGVPTVKTHVSTLLRVLGRRDRTQLAVLACRRPPVPRPARAVPGAPRRGRDLPLVVSVDCQNHPSEP